MVALSVVMGNIGSNFMMMVYQPQKDVDPDLSKQHKKSHKSRYKS